MWIDILKQQPKDNTEVHVKFEDNSEGKLMYWNECEGFDAQTEPHHIMVTHWKCIKHKFKTVGKESHNGNSIRCTVCKYIELPY